MPRAAPTATACGAGLWASGLLTFGFLAGQLVVWKQLNDAGYFVSTSAAAAFFYLFTAVHGLHVLGGLVAWARASAQGVARRGSGQDPAGRRTVRDLLALPARRLGGAVCAAGVGTTSGWRSARRRRCDRQGAEAHDDARSNRYGRTRCPRPAAWQSIVADVSSDQRAFKGVPWGKPMMWIFLLSDTFIFGSFLISYMTVRMSTTVPWPNPSEVFSLMMFGKNVPLLLIAIMTFILISSSGTMALAVNFGYRRDRKTTFALLLATAALGATFVGMQAFEWSKLISEGVRPWGNPWGAAQFGSSFFMITGFHGTHVTIGVIFLVIVAVKVLRGDLDQQRPGFLTGRRGNYEIVEILGLYWHFVDLVWVFIFAFFYLW